MLLSGQQNDVLRLIQLFFSSTLNVDIFLNNSGFFKYPNRKYDYTLEIDSDVSILHNSSSPHAMYV